MKDLLPLAEKIGALLKQRKETIAIAESSAGGLIAASMLSVPGASAYFLGGVIAYADEVKRAQLGVPQAMLARVGAVSAEVAQAMAEGARSRFGSDLAVAVTGIAGPESA